MAFTWRDVLKGLDSGLEIVKYVAAIIPGGQAIAVGATMVDGLVEKINETYADSEMLDKEIIVKKDVVSDETDPIDTIVSLIDSIVLSQSDEVVITNEAVMKIVEAMSKSKGNNVDGRLIIKVKNHLYKTSRRPRKKRAASTDN